MTLNLDGSVVALTGAGGFVGTHVSSALRASGATVRAFEGDLRVDDLGPWVRGADAVIHLAARSGGIAFQGASDAEVFSANVRMTERVLSAAETANARRVFLASSAVVYDATSREVLEESAPTVSPGVANVTGYAWSKLTSELLGSWFDASTSLDVVSGRFTNIYGPGGHFEGPAETVIHALVRKAVEARTTGGVIEVWGDGTAERDFLFVDDAADAVLRVLTDGTAGDRYNIGSGRAISIAQLTDAVVQAAIPPGRVQFERSRPSGPSRRVLDVTKILGLGWRPRIDLGEGLQRTVQWWESHRSGTPPTDR